MGESKSDQVQDIVNKLTRDLYSHDYIIGRTEAKETLGLNIEETDGDTEKIIWRLYKAYEELLELTIPLAPSVLLGSSNEVRCTFTRGVIESRLRVDAFQSDQEFRRVQATPPGALGPIFAYQGQTFSESWVRNAKV